MATSYDAIIDDQHGTDGDATGTLSLAGFINCFFEVPIHAYNLHHMIDDDIGDNISELSGLVNNPSAEGFITTGTLPAAATSTGRSFESLNPA